MSKASTALIIDDEPDIRELIAMSITRMGIDCHVAANLEEARNLLAHYDFDICLTDMRLPDGNGVEFVRYVLSVQPALPVAVITAHGNMQAAVEAMKNGAFDFVSKPVDVQLLRKLVSSAIATRKKAANDAHMNMPAVAHEKTSNNTLEHQLIGESSPMSSLRQMISKVAQSNAPVWITGESGTGKELIARLIHESSVRAKHPFIPINCGAIPSELMESELFGHRKGSFTGAITDNPGLFRKAEGGTLFLDEVAELPLSMQVKLLRAIQEKAVRGVGEDRETPVDVRILSASHKDLAAEVQAGRFRHDLYYRLNVIQLRSPALRERIEDIPLLATRLLPGICEANHFSHAQLTNDALKKLQGYSFPGNVRELENILERSIALSTGSTIDADDIQLPEPSRATLTDVSIPDSPSANENCEEAQIRNALTETRWNRKAAAERLGLTYRQLRYRIQQYGIDRKGS